MVGDKKVKRRLLSILSLYILILSVYLVMCMSNIYVTITMGLMNAYMLQIYRGRGVIYRKYYSKIGRYKQEIEVITILILAHLFMGFNTQAIIVDFGLVFLISYIYCKLFSRGREKLRVMHVSGLIFTMLLIKVALIHGFTVDILVVVLALVGVQIYNAYNTERQHYLTKLSNLVLHLSTIIIIVSAFSTMYIALVFVLLLSVLHLNPQSKYSSIGRYIR